MGRYEPPECYPPYHQDERDRIANTGCLVLIGVMAIVLVMVAACVAWMLA